MINKIRVMLEYRCYPVWLYDEDGDVIDTLLPEELRNDRNLDKKIDELQSRFDNLFIDNDNEFRFLGFESDEQQEDFLADWDETVSELKRKVNGIYPIIDDIELVFKRRK